MCTGALLLGAAGVLEGEPATTHWCAYDQLGRLRRRRSPSSASCATGKVVTGAGVSAGIDMALTLVGLHGGRRTSPRPIQLGIEYDPQPPYDAGAPSKARPEIKDLVEAVVGQAEAAI